MVELRRRNLGQQFGQFNGRDDGCIEEAVVERQLRHLPGGRIDQFVATITNIHAPQAGHAVEDLVALRIPDIDAVAARDDARATAGQSLGIGKGMHVMGAVALLQRARVELLGFDGVHVSDSLFFKRAGANAGAPTG